MTVLMPDFEALPTENFLMSWMKETDEATNNDIKRAFGKVKNHEFDEDNVKNEYVGDQEQDGREESLSELLIKNDENSEEKENYGYESDHAHFNAEISISSKIERKAKKFRLRKERVFRDSILPLIEKRIEALENEMILYPLNERDFKNNSLKAKNIALQRAHKEVITTGCSNRKAAAKFGFSEASLRRFLKHPDTFGLIGQGNKHMFTTLEEKRIAEKALKISGGGVNMTYALLKRVVDEETLVIQKQQPNREISHMSSNAIRRLGHRNGLFDIRNEIQASEKHDECDVCFQKFKMFPF